MICPHCDYMHGLVYKGTDIVSIDGDFGEFWKLCVPMEKQEKWEQFKATLRACPKCYKTFIGED